MVPTGLVLSDVKKHDGVVIVRFLYVLLLELHFLFFLYFFVAEIWVLFTRLTSCTDVCRERRPVLHDSPPTLHSLCGPRREGLGQEKVAPGRGGLN